MPPRTSSAGPNCNTLTRASAARRALAQRGGTATARHGRTVVGSALIHDTSPCSRARYAATMAATENRLTARARAAAPICCRLRWSAYNAAISAGSRARELGRRHHVAFDAVVDHLARAADVATGSPGGPWTWPRARHSRMIRRPIDGSTNTSMRGQHRAHVVELADETHAVGDLQRRGAAQQLFAQRPVCRQSPGAHRRAPRAGGAASSAALPGSSRAPSVRRVPMQQCTGLHAERRAQPLGGFEGDDAARSARSPRRCR